MKLQALALVLVFICSSINIFVSGIAPVVTASSGNSKRSRACSCSCCKGTLCVNDNECSSSTSDERLLYVGIGIGAILLLIAIVMIIKYYSAKHIEQERQKLYQEKLQTQQQQRQLIGSDNQAGQERGEAQSETGSGTSGQIELVQGRGTQNVIVKNQQNQQILNNDSHQLQVNLNFNNNTNPSNKNFNEEEQKKKILAKTGSTQKLLPLSTKLQESKT